MNRDARGILVGMVFGDSYLNVRQRGGHISSEMRVLHSLKQADYCRHKAELLRKLLNRNFTANIIKNGPGGKYWAINFSATHPYFKQLKKWCYPGGKKTYTTKTLNMLTPQGIAYWYMDDGSCSVNINKHGWVSSCSTSIATMCSLAEVDTIVDWFLNEYGIEFKVRHRKTSSPEFAYSIQTNTNGSREFAGIVQPYIIPSMMYKLAHVADLKSHECRASTGICVECSKPIYDARHKGLCVTCYTRQYHRKSG